MVYPHGKKDVTVDDNPAYLQLSEDEGERKRKYREYIRGMLKEKEAMKKEMDKRMVYGNTGFAGEMTKKYKIQEMIRPKGRQIGWRKN